MATGMKLQRDRPHILALMQRLPERAHLHEHLRFGHCVERRSVTLPVEALGCLAALHDAAAAPQRLTRCPRR